jgi:peptide/nickel transport system substrate-binding protein
VNQFEVTLAFEVAMSLLNKTLIAATAAILSLGWTSASFAEAKHAIAMHGEPALADGFTHFPYADPAAPKGGTFTYCVVGTFDNLNPFILNSMRTTARGMIDALLGNLVFQPLMERSRDEAFTMYGLIAEKIETDEERTFAEFTINANAKWSDGTPITPDDVIFTYETYTAKGRPPYKDRMKRIEKIEKTADNKVKFTFNKDSNREFPLIIALTPIIPKHATNAEKFEDTTLAPMVGSGPYTVGEVVAGTRITFNRNPNYWGAAVPAHVGHFNFDKIIIEYFRNDAAQFEAFKSGLCDINVESDPTKWAQAYDFPAVASGDVIKGEFTDQLPTPMLGFVFNTRRDMFKSIEVRKALATLYDFEWANQNLYQGTFKRIGSYWENSELASTGKPMSDGEKAILADAVAAMPADIADGSYRPAESDGTGRDRTIYKTALDAFKLGGYELKEGKLVNAAGAQLAFELLTASAEQEKMALALQRNVEKLGIAMTIRAVDDAQMQERKGKFDYDMMVTSIGFSGSLSPGIEQISRWGSSSQSTEGSFNYAGVADPAVDRAIDALVNARDRAVFVDAVRALDRLLIAGHYMIPLQYKPASWLAYKKQLQFPKYNPVYGYTVPTWWRVE